MRGAHAQALSSQLQSSKCLVGAPVMVAFRCYHVHRRRIIFHLIVQASSGAHATLHMPLTSKICMHKYYAVASGSVSAAINNESRSGEPHKANSNQTHAPTSVLKTQRPWHPSLLPLPSEVLPREQAAAEVHEEEQLPRQPLHQCSPEQDISLDHARSGEKWTKVLKSAFSR